MNNSSLKVTESEIKAYSLKNEINPEEVSSSLQKSLMKMPEILEQIVVSLKNPRIKDTIAFFKKFSRFANGDSEVNLEILEYILEKDNDLVEVYEGEGGNREEEKNGKRYENLKNHICGLFQEFETAGEEIRQDIVWDIKLEESSSVIHSSDLSRISKSKTTKPGNPK